MSMVKAVLCRAVGEVEGAVDRGHLLFGVWVRLDWTSLLEVWFDGVIGGGG